MVVPEEQPRWHQALAYAILGEECGSLGVQAGPRMATVISELRAMLPAETLVERVAEVRRSGRPWPHPVPAALMAGIGYAQFAAALAQLRRELAVDAPVTAPAVRSSRRVPEAERRLLEDVPPHHGT